MNVHGITLFFRSKTTNMCELHLFAPKTMFLCESRRGLRKAGKAFSRLLKAGSRLSGAG